MIFSCDKNTLMGGLNIVSKALPAKSVNPIGTGIFFRAKGEELILISTDNFLTVETKIAADVSEEGEVVIDGKFVSEMVRKMPEGNIKISGDCINGLEVTGSFSKMNIAGLDPDEYPELPFIDKDKFFTVPQNELKELINQTIFATAQDESRPVLTGCLFELEASSMRVVALDGFRLALRNSFVEDVDGHIEAIIPARALSEIVKILSDTEDVARIYIEKSYCMFELNETKVISRLIDGQFINYKPIIPQSMEYTVTIDRLDMLEAIDRAWLIVRENTRNNHIIFRFQNDKLIITSRSDTGNAYEEVAVSGKYNKEMEIGFNPRYFVECLRNIDDEFITFSFTRSNYPTAIKPVDGDKYYFLILPVRL